MTYLDLHRLDAIDEREFQSAKPYPWLGFADLLTPEGYQRLVETLPDVSRFQPYFAVPRAHGQQSHDRYVLEYRDDLDVADAWHEFVRELRGERYRRFLRRMLGRGMLTLSYHWHYTPAGCSVSPHCDAKHKLGSHIFYLNTPADWDPSWGGETLILDDGGRFSRSSAPRFEDFDAAFTAESIGNRSLLFGRGERSWHGVREIQCPEGAFRKVFIVVIGDRLRTLRHRLKARLRGQTPSSY
jgi:hypothetical protein